jgi:polygalacturonase
VDTLKKFSTFLLLSFLILPGIAEASGQDSINELIKNGGNVTLSGTYTLTGPIMLSSDLKLNGQNSTIITIPNDADWSVWIPLMTGVGLHDVTIEGIEFNANADGNEGTPYGRGYYNCLHVIDCKNVTVRN